MCQHLRQMGVRAHVFNPRGCAGPRRANLEIIPPRDKPARLAERRTPMQLGSLRVGYRAAVFGASGGIGRALVEALQADVRCGLVHAGARTLCETGPGKTRPFAFDLEDGGSIEAAAALISADEGLDLAIVATGRLHGSGLQPEKTMRSLDAGALQEAFLINAVGPAMIASRLLPRLPRERRTLFAVLSARVGAISDNRLGGWHSYRASKAALNMLVRTLAVEQARTHPQGLCVALHPGTVDTGLSKPFQAGLAPDRLFTPAHAAGRLLGVLDRLTPDCSGRLFGWDGQEISP